MMPWTCRPSSSAKITSSGLMRSVWPKIWGATTWPSSCCRPMKVSVTQSAEIGSVKSATTIAGSAPRIGPT